MTVAALLTGCQSVPASDVWISPESRLLAVGAGGALRGAGDTRWPFLVQTLLAWLLRLPLVWLFAFALEKGVVGAWYAEFTFVLALAAALGWRLRSGDWKTVRI